MTICEPVGFIGEKFVVRQFLSESLSNKYLKILCEVITEYVDKAIILIRTFYSVGFLLLLVC